MSPLLSVSITTGIFSGIWVWMADSLSLLSWAGFLGCTGYFASKGDIKSLIQTISANLAGVGWAIVIASSASFISGTMGNYLMVTLVAFLMCIQARYPLLSYIPGTFIGACSTFAADGQWQPVIPSLILGAVIGFLMKQSGRWLHYSTSR
ncbi:Inner membrane protein YcdZ [invertebrate metagenome]|uniref:Inner membrane protein YcdZ n=1 Tax=invertebrate metagenome TaxID=1711999 RepID=A0A2H9TAM9_9ZZZZ